MMAAVVLNGLVNYSAWRTGRVDIRPGSAGVSTKPTTDTPKCLPILDQGLGKAGFMLHEES